MIRKMRIGDYQKIYDLWISCKGMVLTYRNMSLVEMIRIDT